MNMKRHLLQLDIPQYTIFDLRAHPHDDEKLLQRELPLSLAANMTLSKDGNHFAMVFLSQESKDYAYTFEVQAFATFRLERGNEEIEVQTALNPADVVLNVARLLFSSARELLNIVSSRAVHGPIVLPTFNIQPSDIDVEFEGDRFEVLRTQFGMTEEQIAQMRSREALHMAGNVPVAKPSKRRSSKRRAK